MSKNRKKAELSSLELSDDEPINQTSHSTNERINQIESIFINCPRISRIKDQIGYCHQHSKVAAEPECLLITGNTGAGKTKLCQLYTNQFIRQRTKEGVSIPVLSTSIPVPASAKSLATRLLETLGDPFAGKGTTVSQTLRLAGLFKDCGVELIILDEFQHFIDRESNNVLITVSNWLKDLLNQTGIPMILVGMPYSNMILQSNDQLARRFTMRAQLDPFNWESKKDQIEFRTFLHYVDCALPFPERSELRDYETARRIFLATGGVIGHVMKLIRRASILALERSLNKIEYELLAEVYNERLAELQPKQDNPFYVDSSNLNKDETKHNGKSKKK